MLKPIGNKIVLELVKKEEVTKGGIYIPETSKKEDSVEGTVVAVGSDVEFDGLEVGGSVLFAKNAGFEVKESDKTYRIIVDSDVLAVIK